MKGYQWECGRFGLRCRPQADLLDIPDVAGVYVLFFEEQRCLVGMAPNLFRRILQSWYAPGRSFIGFSWMEVVSSGEREHVYRLLQTRQYEQLWEDIRLDVVGEHEQEVLTQQSKAA